MELMQVRPLEKNKITRVVKAKLQKELISKTMKKPNIDELEEILGFDKVNPIVLSDADLRDEMEKGDYFREWYEEELRGLYERCKY